MRQPGPKPEQALKHCAHQKFAAMAMNLCDILTCISARTRHINGQHIVKLLIIGVKHYAMMHGPGPKIDETWRMCQENA